MNNRDRDNLNFIMSLNDRQFDDWALESTDDDLQYAMELLRQARTEQMLQEQALMEYALDESEFAEARTVLEKFRL